MRPLFKILHQITNLYNADLNIFMSVNIKQGLLNNLQNENKFIRLSVVQIINNIFLEDDLHFQFYFDEKIIYQLLSMVIAEPSFEILLNVMDVLNNIIIISETKNKIDVLNQLLNKYEVIETLLYSMG